MEATREQIDMLRKLQEADRQRLQAELALSRLPQPAQIEELRTKLSMVVGKIADIEALDKEATEKLTALAHEDDMLAAKQQDLQEQIQQSQEDFRKVAQLTRELESRAKRRETVEFEMTKADERQSEIRAVLAKAIAARDGLAKQGQDLTADYQKEGLALKEQIEQGKARRSELAALLPEDLLARYNRLIDKCGGIALSLLDGQKCSACRSVIDESRVVQIRKEAPLSTCPHCGRMLIVEGNDRA